MPRSLVCPDILAACPTRAQGVSDVKKFKTRFLACLTRDDVCPTSVGV